MMIRLIWNVCLAWLAFVTLIGLLALGSCALSPARAQSRLDNLVSGSSNTTGTGATTIIAAPSATRRLYITAVECGRTDAGTTAVRATLNDDGATVIIIANSGGGGYAPVVFADPLTVAAATALTFTMSSGVTTAYCSAQGFSGN